MSEPVYRLFHVELDEELRCFWDVTSGKNSYSDPPTIIFNPVHFVDVIATCHSDAIKIAREYILNMKKETEE